LLYIRKYTYSVGAKNVFLAAGIKLIFKKQAESSSISADTTPNKRDEQVKTLSSADLIALNRVIAEIYASRDVEAFYQSVFSSIQSVIPCELVSFTERGVVG